jgi:hypothetical protein
VASFRLIVAVATSLSAALLPACETHGYVPPGAGGWYEHRQDEIGCAGAARHSGLFPGDAYDSYVSNCVYDRQRERWRHWQQ